MNDKELQDSFFSEIDKRLFQKIQAYFYPNKAKTGAKEEAKKV